MSSTDGTKTRATHAAVLLTLGRLLHNGAPAPFSVELKHYHDTPAVVVYTGLDAGRAERWARLLGLPPVAPVGKVYDVTADGTPWRKWESTGVWLGWDVSVWCRINVPAPATVDSAVPA